MRETDATVDLVNKQGRVVASMFAFWKMFKVFFLQICGKKNIEQ